MEKPSINQNPMPEIRILPSGVERVLDLTQRAYKYGRAIVRNTNIQFSMLPSQSERCLSEHNRGGGPLLDRELENNQLSLEYED